MTEKEQSGGIVILLKLPLWVPAIHRRLGKGNRVGDSGGPLLPLYLAGRAETDSFMGPDLPKKI